MEDNRLAVDTRGIILSQLPSLDTDAEGGHSKDPRGGSQLKKHERGLHRQSAILYLYRQQTNNHQQHQQQQHHHQHQQPTTNTFVVDKLEAVVIFLGEYVCMSVTPGVYHFRPAIGATLAAVDPVVYCDSLRDRMGSPIEIFEAEHIYDGTGVVSVDSLSLLIAGTASAMAQMTRSVD